VTARDRFGHDAVAPLAITPYRSRRDAIADAEPSRDCFGT
jgi:hypothetical protein